MLKRLTTICFIFISVSSTFAQTKKLSGKIIDQHTQEPIEFATIYLKGTTNGATADASGSFSLLYNEKCDSVEFSSVGYNKIKMKLSGEPEQFFKIEMERAATSFKAITVHLGQDPAYTLFKRIQLHKRKNDKNKLDYYQYLVYNKLELDVDKISDKISTNRILKPFGFIKNYIDSTSEDKPFLPVYLTESLSDFYYRKNPSSHKEVIKATQMAGGTDESLSQFLGTMYQDENIYENRLLLMGVYFISPIANGGLFYYHYKITDTAYLEGRKCFKLSFQPKRSGENTFIGEMWVNDSTWAIKQISMSTSKDANINFVNKISVFQSYTKFGDTLWMMNKDKFIVSFKTGGKGRPGIIGRKTTLYKNIIVNNPSTDTAFADHQDLIVLNGASAKNSDFWMNNRPDSLSKNEKNIYKLVDTIQKVPAFKHYKQLFTTLATGYFQSGYFSYGPYYNIFALNHVEGARVGFGISNSELVSTKLWLNTQFAYGFTDHKIKYDFNTWYIFKKLPRRELKVRYVNDVVTYNLLDEQLGENNLFSSLIRRVPYYSKLTHLEETKISYNHEWKSGFGEKITFQHSSIHSFFDNTFYPNGIADFTPSFINTTISLTTRFAYHEKFIAGDFLRASIGSDYPIVTFELKQSVKGFLNSEFSYQKIKLQIDGNKSTGTVGSFFYSITAEKTLGNLPMILLDVLPGNDTYYYDKYCFNNMTRYEFIADRLISARFYEYFGGFPLTYIPIIKKLKWRTFVGGKAVLGDMSDANKQLNGYNDNNAINPFSIPNKKPYIELGTGIENIFKVFRLDFVWRLNYLDKTTHPYSQPFGIRGSLQVEF